MAHYRHTWTNATTGWQMRFDIVPYGSQISSSTVALGAGTVLADNLQQESSFDNIPFGLMNAPTLSVKLNYDRLPTAVQSALETFQSAGGDRNLFLLWSDRGTGTWTVEFAGTEEQTENLVTQTNDLGEEEYSLNLIDALYHATLTLRAQDVFLASQYAPKNYRNLLEVATPDYIRTEIVAYSYLGYNMRIRTIAELATIIKTKLTTYLTTSLTRTANVSVSATVDASDINARIGDYIDTGARFYKASSTFPRVKAASLTDATAHLVTHILNFSNSPVGGLFALGDDYSIAAEQSLLDFIKSFSETMCVKVSWKPIYVADAGGDYITWAWDIACMFSNTRTDAVLTTLSMAEALESGDLDRGAESIGRTEIQFPLASKDQDRNVTQVEYSNGRSRGERSINIEPVVHNVVSMKDKVIYIEGAWNAYQDQITQTNLICYDSDLIDNQMDKAHEDTRVVVVGAADGGAAVTFVDVSVATDHPWLTSPNFEDRSAMDVDPSQSIALQAWINDVQRNSCLPFALAKSLFLAYSSPMQATVEITWRINANTVPAKLGACYSLTGARATKLPSINWARACIVSVKTDWIKGTSQINYFMPDLSNF